MKVSKTLSVEPLAYVLNTRPCLNFLQIDRFDMLSAALGPEIYVPPEVIDEIRRHSAWTAADLENRPRRSPQSINPQEIASVNNLQRWQAYLGPPVIRRLHELDFEELNVYARYRDERWLDPGECEVLALAKNRGWVAVLDERAAHGVAIGEGIANTSTLGVLVGSVQRGNISADIAGEIWRRIQEQWDYAPSGNLTEYLAGKAIW